MFFVSVSDEICQHEQAHSDAIFVANSKSCEARGA